MGSTWHQANTPVVYTAGVDAVNLTPWAPAPSETLTSEPKLRTINITSQLNTTATQFGAVFFDEISNLDPDFKQTLSSSSIANIVYSDRYLQSPMSLILLGLALHHLHKTFTSHTKIKIQTLFRAKETNGYRIFHDWADEQNYQNFASLWLREITQADISLRIHDSNKNIPHHRQMAIEFTNGKKLLIQLDQGFGYWRLWTQHPEDNNFEFHEPAETQVRALVNTIGAMKILASSQRWGTDLFVQLQ